ncbi:hypothetical protein F4806DRAFT_16892 [Annulohypoxylon nitens]|nr:hypothetical protein F4806DRAFT_16892 [Annulohypoxylon nitens]
MNDPTREKTSNSAQLKKLKEAAKRSLPNDYDLPEPKFRQVAGDVRRRSDRNVEAEPPPAPAPSTRRPAQYQRSNHGKILNNGNNGDDGSDSDSDKPRRSHGESTTSITQRQPAKQSPLDSLAPAQIKSSNSMSLTPEEQERINRRRMLENDEVGWRHSMQTFRALNSQAEEFKKVLLENEHKITLNGDNAGRHFHRTIIRLQEKRMREFLYEASGHETATRERAGDIESTKASYNQDDLMQDIIERIELDFILRWEKRANLSGLPEGYWPNHTTTSDLLLEIINTCRYYANYLRPHTNHLRSTPSDASADFSLPISATYISRPSASSDDPFPDGPFPDDHYGSLAMNYERAIFSMPIEESRILLRSPRKDGRLSYRYIEWVYSHLPDFKIESAMRRRRDEKYYEDKGRYNSEDSKSRVLQNTQFFCDDTKYRRGVMLVYSTNDSTPSGRHVPSQDLHRFGWFRDVTYGQKYCRYDFDETSWSTFKVAMDGKVLALVKPEGCVYIEPPTTSF